jgi:predicted nucleotidyltransferase component of viral defense system
MSFFNASSPVALNKAARLFGTRRSDYVEIDVLLTHLLQRMHEMGLMDHLVFKGGTMLRKMVFGSNGRLSTDLDFVVRSITGIEPDDMALEIASAFQTDYRGIRFDFNFAKDLGTSEGACRANPKCMTNFTPGGHVIKIEVSYRADPVLAPVMMPQLTQTYFSDLDFTAAEIPCLRLEEAIGEKIRAAFQRPKIRDLHDLQQLRRNGFDPDMVRRIAVLKIWESPGGSDFEPFSYDAFVKRMNRRVEKKAYDEGDLRGLLRQNQSVDLSTMVRDVSETYDFLNNLTSDEVKLTMDKHKQEVRLSDVHRVSIQTDDDHQSSLKMK